MAAILTVRLTVLSFIPTCLLVVFCLSYQLCLVESTDPVMRKPDFKSSNNVHSVNNSSYIQWGKVPQAKPLDLPDEEKSDGLGPLFKFSRFFAYNTLSSKLPEDLIHKMKKGNSEILEDAKAFALKYWGFLTAIIFGLGFIIIFPIVGCCFCLCRCCGNCGGKMIHPSEKRCPMRRKILSALLFLGIVFSACGTAFMYASDSRLTNKMEHAPEVLPNILSAVATFGNNTYWQFDFVGTESVGFLLEVIKRDLNNVDVLVGIPLRDKLDQEANITTIFKTVETLNQNLGDLLATMTKTKTGAEDLKKSIDALGKVMTVLKNDIDADYQKCNTANMATCPKDGLKTGSLDTTFNPTQLPDISNEITKISAVNLTEQIQKAKEDFRNIPERARKESLAKIQDVIKVLDDIKNNKIQDYLNKAKTFSDDLNAGKVATLDLEDIKKQSHEIFDIVKPFDKIRSYAFIGLASFCLLMVSFLFFGLFLGCCGYDDLVNPVKRSSRSNCGGCLLMTAVVFIFLFGCLLMLLTTVMFIPGTVVEVYGCKTLREIGEGSVDKIIKVVLDKNVGELLFKNGNGNMTISHIYNDCKRNEGLYKAAYLDNTVDLNTFYDYPKNQGVKSDLTAIPIDLSSIKIYTAQMQKQIDDSKQSLNIDFNKFTTELSKVNAADSLNTLAVKLNDLTKIPIYGPDFAKHLTTLERIQKNELKDTDEQKTKLSAFLDDLKNNSLSTTKVIDNLKTLMQHADDVIKTNGTKIVGDILQGFIDRIFRVWDNFVVYIKDLLNNQLGKCRPVVEIYDYLLIDTLCGYVDSFNAYWFGLGWCLVFLVFSQIVAVKLAKYFRRMEFSDELDGSQDIQQQGAEMSMVSNSNFSKHNKVGQMPRY